MLQVDAAGSSTITKYDERDRVSTIYQPVPDTLITPFESAVADMTSAPTGWDYVSDSRAYGGGYYRVNGSTSQTVSWTPELLPSAGESRKYVVLATWVPSDLNDSGATFLLNVDGQLVAGVNINQKLAPADYQDTDGRWWHVVTDIIQPADTDTEVELMGYPGAQADAVKILEVGPSTTYAYDRQASCRHPSIRICGRPTTNTTISDARSRLACRHRIQAPRQCGPCLRQPTMPPATSRALRTPLATERSLITTILGDKFRLFSLLPARPSTA